MYIYVSIYIYVYWVVVVLRGRGLAEVCTCCEWEGNCCECEAGKEWEAAKELRAC